MDARYSPSLVPTIFTKLFSLAFSVACASRICARWLLPLLSYMIFSYFMLISQILKKPNIPESQSIYYIYSLILVLFIKNLPMTSSNKNEIRRHVLPMNCAKKKDGEIWTAQTYNQHLIKKIEELNNLIQSTKNRLFKIQLGVLEVHFDSKIYV